MYYSVPPSVAVSFFTTNAVANTQNNNVSVIPTPGAGFALRILGIHLVGARSNTGHVNAFFHDSLGNPIWRGGTVVGAGSDDGPIPPPGYQLPENTALQLDNLASVASQVVYWTVWYVTDDVS